jgi:hypothetical protein
MIVLSVRPTSVGHSEIGDDVRAVRFVGEPVTSTEPLLLGAVETLRAGSPIDRTLHVGTVPLADSALLNAMVAFGAHTPRRGRRRGDRG